jgi:hypothetical protein
MYKISHIINGTVKFIYVFIGPQKNGEELNKLFQKNPADKRFDAIFTPEERDDILADEIQVKFISESIHLDDTIEIIKKKLLFHLMDDLNASFDELYFFMVQPEQFKAVAIYQNLTQNEKLELTKERLVQFLLNVDEFDVASIPNKDVYTYDDIHALNLEQTECMVYKPLGQKIVSLKDDYPFTVNPYLAEFYDPFLEKFADEIITTTNKNILMDRGALLNNTIYLCLAEDVLAFGTEYNQDLTETNTLKIYFPYLYAKDITTLEQLSERKQELLGETKAMLTPTFTKNIENVNLFYDIYAERNDELKFNDVGIKSIILTIHQPVPFHLPLDNVFKLIHATQDVPLIKMNLSKRQENIYRLYADKIATNGKKIPYLDKGAIFKWDKLMGKNKSVAVYIEHYEEETGSVAPIVCEFNDDGSILIKANFNTSLSVESINELLNKEVNPVINVVRDYLAQDGYLLANFVDLNTHEILNIEFAMNIQIEKDIKLKKIVGCLTSMFNVINDNLTNGIMLRFKRVSNYNEMESQEALILDMSQPYLGYSDGDIVKVLQTNFNLSEKDAIEKYAEVKRAQEVMQAGNKKMKKRNNPGFLTTIVKQPYNDIVMINVSGINHIGYLKTLTIYLDTLIRITQKKSSTQVSRTAIKRICAGKKTEDEEQVDEIIAHIEQPNAENIQMTIVAEELVFNKPEEIIEERAKADEGEAEALMDEDEFLARYGYNEEEEEPEEEEEGGAGASTSEADSDAASEADSDAASEADSDAASEADSDAEDEDDALDTDITGQSLANPSLFEKRMRKRDKNLFVTDTGNENFSSYATDCQMNRRRHPVILTDEEKERIDKDHPGSYSEAVKYGSNPSKQFWYICPRYWDLKKNVSLNEAEVDKNLVIPKKTPGNKVPAGKQIFEFNDYGIEHLKNNEYITHYPGFLKPEKGKCLPCCFKTWDGPTQTARRSQCTKDNTIVVQPGRKKKKAAEEIDEYILAPDKFPILQENRFGYLPIAVQKFLHTDNKKCQISEMNTNLKQNHECLLRHSVEINQNQSFIACIADIWFENYKSVHKEKTRPTIKRMKEIFSETLSIDNFITLQNGNLIKLFYPNSAGETDAADLAKYAEVFSTTNSKLYQRADKTKPSEMSALIKIARAYTNFLAYLKDDTVEIDYEYLWDLICKPNPKLFPNGINLVIIELSRKDITDNVELICPSNHYSSSFFDAKKSAIVLLKIDNFYEPIYAYKTTEDEITITRTFNIMYKDTMPNIKYVLSLVKTTLNNKCAPMASMPNVYKFEKNIPLEKLSHQLQILNYTIQQNVMNYDSKIIGVVAINNQDNTKGFIPCYVSALSASTTFDNVVFMEEASTMTYEETKAFLEQVYTKSKRQIPCKPYMKVIEDGLIVGILTMTNQFVAIAEPTQDTFGNDLKIMNNVSYTSADATLSSATTVDEERVNYIKKIQLETKFYNVFRNTARYLLGQYEHNDARKEIEEKTNSSQPYLKKLRSIETLLRELMAPHIQFHAYAEADLMKLKTITNCYTNCANKAYCQENTDGTCSLLIPETNLINEKSNDTFYYGKLADEIVRYSRIKTFIFNPKAVLSFSQLKYNLRENEIILLQSLLTQDYFENIIPAKVNQYIKKNTYDTTQPILAQNYSNVESYEKIVEANDQENVEPSTCNTSMKEYIANKYWAAVFPINSKEQVYLSTPAACSFNAILTLIKQQNEADKELTQNELKEVLFEEYKKLYTKYGQQLIQILRAQGKKILAGQITKKQLSLGDMIMSEDYYATILDVWILAIRYNIPLVFISETSLMENNSRFMVAHTPEETAYYYFLKVSAVVPQLAPVYTLILNPDNTRAIDVGSIRNETIQTELRGGAAENNLANFIVKFSLTEANARKKTLKVVPAPPAARPAPPLAAPPLAAPPAAPPAAPLAPPLAAPLAAPPAAPAASPAPVIKKLDKKVGDKKIRVKNLI